MAKIIDGLVLNGQSYEFTATDINLADIETDQGAASKAYAVGEHLILDGQYYIVTAPIAENDGLVIDTNIRVENVGNEITGLRNSFSQALTDLKATPIAQAVGAVGTTFASVIAKLGEIVNRGAWSANMANTGSVTIPAGYHDGTGTVKTSGTATITTNGTHNIAQYSSVNVNVPSKISVQNFTRSTSGYHYVNCGFRPTYILIVIRSNVGYRCAILSGQTNNTHYCFGTIGGSNYEQWLSFGTRSDSRSLIQGIDGSGFSMTADSYANQWVWVLACA